MAHNKNKRKKTYQIKVVTIEFKPGDKIVATYEYTNAPSEDFSLLDHESDEMKAILLKLWHNRISVTL